MEIFIWFISNKNSLGYALSQLANIHTGTPERPLSTQGLLCYRKHWKSKIFDYLLTKTNDEQIAINGLYRFFVLEYGSVSNDTFRR